MQGWLSSICLLSDCVAWKDNATFTSPWDSKCQCNCQQWGSVQSAHTLLLEQQVVCEVAEWAPSQGLWGLPEFTLSTRDVFLWVNGTVPYQMQVPPSLYLRGDLLGEDGEGILLAWGNLWAGHINSVKRQKHATCRWKQQPESTWPWGWTWNNSPGPGNSPRRLPWVSWSTRLSLWLSPFSPFNCYKWISVDLQDLLELTPKKRCTFHHRRLDAKVRSQEIPGISGKFGLGVQNEAGWRLTEFYQENTLFTKQTPSFKSTSDDSTHGHHQMVNTKIRLIIFFTAEDGEALYHQ